jgi:hypothetical protein
METKQQTVDRIEQAAWESETIRFRASKRAAFKDVLSQAYDAGRDAGRAIAILRMLTNEETGVGG